MNLINHAAEPSVEVVLFDLLTALLDSWTVWNHAAGTEHAGRAWRAEYLRLTYGCGAYRPYELLVREAAAATGLDEDAGARLERAWDALLPWPEAQTALNGLAGKVKLGVVTNCSDAMGRRAAARLNVRWDVIVTAEEAGYYKPNPRPYELALERLHTKPARALFVAGSGYDLFGTGAVGLRTYWHNRIGLSRPKGAPAAEIEAPTLEGLADWVLKGRA